MLPDRGTTPLPPPPHTPFASAAAHSAHGAVGHTHPCTDITVAQLVNVAHAPKSSKPWRFFIRSGKRSLYMQGGHGRVDEQLQLILAANNARAAHAKFRRRNTIS